MMVLKKRVISFLLCTIMMVLAGCGQGKTEDGKGNKTDAGAQGNGKGRYLESDVGLPENVENILAIGTLDDGTIRMVTDTGIFDSKDGGKTFEPSQLQYQLQEVNKNEDFLMEAKVDRSGRVLLAYFSSGCRWIEVDGTEKKVPIQLPELEEEQGRVMAHSAQVGEVDEEDQLPGGEGEGEGNTVPANQSIPNYLRNIQITEDGMIVGSDMPGRNIYLIDPESGEIIKTLCQLSEDISSLVQLAVVGNRLVLLTSDGIEVYDMESGKLAEPEPAFRDYFSGQGEGSELDMEIFSSKIYADQTDGIYYGDATGFYHYTFGAGEMERLINGALCSLSNPQLTLIEMIEKKDGGFLGLYRGERGAFLKDYTYSKEAATVPEKELKVYALQDSQFVRQAISSFQAEHPDYYLSLEVGMSGDDGVTAEDAIKKLNTNIMSGNGPDVLVTDGLPLDSYIEKGVLADISDTLEQAKKDSAFFEKILFSSKTKDGVYAVPTRFMLPVLAGPAQDVQDVKNLADLAAALPGIKERNPELKTLIGEYNAEDLARFMLQLSLNEIWKSGGMVDEQALTAYIEGLKKIYTENGEPQDDTGGMMFSMNGKFSQMLDTSINKDLMTILTGKQQLFAGSIQNLNELTTVLGTNNQKNWIYQPLAGLSEQVFIPNDTVGINAKSDRVEDAKEFLKFMLSENAQASAYLPGLSVNKDALEQAYENMKDDEAMISMTGEDGESVDMEMTSGTQQDHDQFISYLEAVSTAPDSNVVVTDAIVKATSDCLVNGSDTAEAVAAILKAVNLYLAE